MAIDDFSSFEELQDAWGPIRSFGRWENQLKEIDRRLGVCEIASGRTDDEVRVIRESFRDVVRILNEVVGRLEGR